MGAVPPPGPFCCFLAHPPRGPPACPLPPGRPPPLQFRSPLPRAAVLCSDEGEAPRDRAQGERGLCRRPARRGCAGAKALGPAPRFPALSTPRSWSATRQRPDVALGLRMAFPVQKDPQQRSRQTPVSELRPPPSNRRATPAACRRHLSFSFDSIGRPAGRGPRGGARGKARLARPALALCGAARPAQGATQERPETRAAAPPSAAATRGHGPGRGIATVSARGWRWEGVPVPKGPAP